MKKFLQYFLSAAVLFVYVCINLSCRFELDSDLRELAAKKGKTFLLMWHENLWTAIWVNKFLQVICLISRSKDGAILSFIAHSLGFKSIRASSSRGYLSATKEILQNFKKESQICLAITPDGPRGPRHVIKPGLLSIAQRCKASLALMTFDYSRSWTLNSWDKFRIPKPFSRVRISYKIYPAGEQDIDLVTQLSETVK